VPLVAVRPLPRRPHHRRVYPAANG
jgi:hypothetical protein